MSVTTDSVPAIVNSKDGFVSLLKKHVKEIGNKYDILEFHCIVHKEALCTKLTEFANVLKVVVKAVNFIVSHVLNHQQFQHLLAEIN